MFDPAGLQQSWDHTHQSRTPSQLPDPEIIAFGDRLQSRLPPGSPVLDVGCGQGRNARYLLEKGFTVHGCDLSPVAVAKTKVWAWQVRAANFLIADLTRLPYADGQFAAAICMHVLPYHFRQGIIQGIGEMQRVLRPGGWLYFDLLAGDDAEYGCGKELEKDTFFDPDGVPIHFCSEREVNDLLAGLTVERLARLELGTEQKRRVAWEIWATSS